MFTIAKALALWMGFRKHRSYKVAARSVGMAGSCCLEPSKRPPNITRSNVHMENTQIAAHVGTHVDNDDEEGLHFWGLCWNSVCFNRYGTRP